MEKAKLELDEGKGSNRKWFQRHDVIVWACGMIFICGLIGVMYGTAISRGWDSPSGYTHNESKSSRERFLSEPYTQEPGVHGRYGVDCTGRWYYWKLPPTQVTALTRLFVWSCYTLHQISVWMFIYYAQVVKTSEPINVPKYSSMFKPFNWMLFLVNVFFHIVHLLQTHVTYDGIAQDVSISSSQSGMIMLLVFVIIMEYRDRGLFFGWPTVHQTDKFSRKLRVPFAPINLIRKYHGYAFAWAAIKTFWYHPMENTYGHAMGFAYTWMFLLQGSLIYTDFHLNKYWRLLLEAWVAIHGGLVAFQTGGPALNGTRLWPMFAFGFGLPFVLTQIFSLPFWRKIHAAFRVIPLAMYMAIAVGCFSVIPDARGNYFVRIAEIIRIPGVYYLYVFWGYGFTWLFLKFEKWILKGRKVAFGPVGRTLFLGLSFFVYFLFVVLSSFIQIFDWQMSLTVLMIFLVGVFTLGVPVANMFLKHALPSKSLNRVAPSNDKKVAEVVEPGIIS